MASSNNILLLYPHQLYPADVLPDDVNQVYLIEDPLLFGRDTQYPLYMHKQKIVLLRASMRRYVEEVLWPAGYQVEYIEFHHMIESGDIVNKLTHAARVEYFDLTDDVLQRRIAESLQALEHKPEVRQLDSANFYLTRNEVKAFFQKKDKSTFADFYRWQRERFNILINPDTYRPLGGKLIFDSETRKRLPKSHKLEGFGVFGSNEFVDEAKEYVNKHFPDNPGSLDDFPWPTSHVEASAWLDEFVENRLDEYGTYQDALDGEAPWIYHSALSPMLNIGLLSPMQVVNRAISRHQQKEVPLASLEAFVRQILGWREFTRGVYLEKQVSLRTANGFNQQRLLTNDWYYATTGLPPVDDVIKKVLSRGYAHHNEREMVLGNAMFLSEFHPDEVYRWFMEMFVDAYDWAVVPTVYGLSQCAEPNSMATKPAVSSSNYVLSMSHYEKGDWCDVWDGLYWNFVERNREQLSHNASMRIATQQLDKIKEERRRIISYRAKDFLKEKTQIPEQNIE